jgi:hypothetical protein
MNKDSIAIVLLWLVLSIWGVIFAAGLVKWAEIFGIITLR